mmetsp:Transcript_5225/g.14025  ORF Transcript_5225/g.14025 Transcript_5225/m.14025 type:complete len:228 (+) Transcript_5225:780-1463(+)
MVEHLQEREDVLRVLPRVLYHRFHESGLDHKVQCHVARGHGSDHDDNACHLHHGPQRGRLRHPRPVADARRQGQPAAGHSQHQHANGACRRLGDVLRRRRAVCKDSADGERGRQAAAGDRGHGRQHRRVLVGDLQHRLRGPQSRPAGAPPDDAQAHVGHRVLPPGLHRQGGFRLDARPRDARDRLAGIRADQEDEVFAPACHARCKRRQHPRQRAEAPAAGHHGGER